jgi:transcriptional regulator with XRE-family HTH domain
MTSSHRELSRARRELFRSLGREIRRIREDAGRSQAAIAGAGSINQAYLSRIEAGNAEPSVEVLMAISAALGCDLSVRLFPNTGPRIRDRFQVAMDEALLGIAHPGWKARPEVPVYRPVRGVIDLVFADPVARVSVATELQSQLRRVEQQIRWSAQKTDALARLPEYEGERIGRLLVVRNTAAMREVVRAAARTLAAAYPGRAADAVASLAGTAPWPVAAIVWTNVERGRATILDGPPRGIAVGR